MIFVFSFLLLIYVDVGVYAAVFLPADGSPDASDASLAFWVDASDTSTILKRANGRMRRWTDKANNVVLSVNRESDNNVFRPAGNGVLPAVVLSAQDSYFTFSDVIVKCNAQNHVGVFVVARNTDGSGRETLMSRADRNVQFFRTDNRDVSFFLCVKGKTTQYYYFYRFAFTKEQTRIRGALPIKLTRIVWFIFQ